MFWLIGSQHNGVWFLSAQMKYNKQFMTQRHPRSVFSAKNSRFNLINPKSIMISLGSLNNVAWEEMSHWFHQKKSNQGERKKKKKEGENYSLWTLMKVTRIKFPTDSNEEFYAVDTFFNCVWVYVHIRHCCQKNTNNNYGFKNIYLVN